MKARPILVTAISFELAMVTYVGLVLTTPTETPLTLFPILMSTAVFLFFIGYAFSAPKEDAKE